MKFIYLFLASIFIISFAKGQDQREIDSLRKNLADTNVDSLSHCLLDMARAFYHLDRDSSMHYNKLALENATLMEDKLHEARAKINIALIKIERNQPEEAEKILKQAIPLAEELQDEISLLMGYSNLGSLKHYGTDYEVAVNYYLKAGEYAKRLGNQYEISRVYYNIADVFNQNKIQDKRNQYYNLAIKHSKTSFPIVYVMACIQMAEYYSEINQDSSSFYLEKAFELEDQINAPQILLEMYSGKGGILAKNKEYELAHTAYQKSLEYAIQLQQDYYLTACYCNLGEIEMYRDNLEKGSNYFQLYQKHQSKSNNDYIAERCLFVWSTLEKNKGNYRLAYELLYERAEIVDSTYSLENRDLLTDLEVKYETATKQAALDQKQAEINARTYQRNLLFGGLGLSVLLGGSFIWGLFSRSKRDKKIALQEQDLNEQKIQTLEQEKKLLSMSSILEGQENERIRIAKDLHDGLGGLLTTVKAHFGKIQSEIEKVENLDIYNTANLMIDKAHDEVRRISHNLMPADLRAGGLPIAVRQLVHELRSIHETETDFELVGFNNTRINEKIELSVYRITQELINNLLKYADASNVFIQLSKFDKEIQIVVEDDGKGFNYNEALASSGLGLKSILSRVEQLNGHMDVVTSSGNGTSVTINIPLSL
ncbi:ATP-binding protein [Portibacter lacus]|uniref:Oxygen sensor histidine kinase NreB n=1 Tax=Portibacter lacus TaxID=1099794 RepID=A0AA37SW43_9BACT|nr:sensor histidine kinase [Portibacter lacus]GLR18815.1 hypothetical protein GCM10007940_34310 [Portibacter lacus]